MSTRPILFSGPMVRALLDGSKTQTRRVLKAEIPPSPGMDAWLKKSIAGEPVGAPRHPAPYLDAYCSERKTPENPRGMSRNWCWWTRDDRQCLPTFRVPYAPGDVLWVRETWSHTGNGVWTTTQAQQALDGKPIYKADGEPTGASFWPSIHMPRRFSRLTLAVTGVKVERLQDISKDDVIAEGCHEREGEPISDVVCGWHEPYAALWNTINGPGSWISNPWVVAVTFAVHQINVDAYLAQRQQENAA